MCCCFGSYGRKIFAVWCGLVLWCSSRAQAAIGVGKFEPILIISEILIDHAGPQSLFIHSITKLVVEPRCGKKGISRRTQCDQFEWWDWLGVDYGPWSCTNGPPAIVPIGHWVSAKLRTSGRWMSTSCETDHVEEGIVSGLRHTTFIVHNVESGKTYWRLLERDRGEYRMWMEKKSEKI